MAGVILTALAAVAGLFGSLILFMLFLLMAKQDRRYKIAVWTSLAATLGCPWTGIWLATRGHPGWGSLIASAPTLYVLAGMVWLGIQQEIGRHPPRR